MKTRLIVAVAVLAWIASAAYMGFLAARWQLDLRVYRDSAQLLVRGGDPMTRSFTSTHLEFTYTPFALLLFTAVGFGSFGLVETVWWLANAAALVLTLFVLIEADRRVAPSSPERAPTRRRSLATAAMIAGLATLALEPVRSDIDYGQINFLLMLLVVVGTTARRSVLRGSLIGLAAAIKLTPLVYLGAFLRRDRRSLLQGAAVFVLLAALSWAIVPKESSQFWLHDIFDASRTGGVASRSNQSWYGLLERPPFHGSVPIWLILSILTAVGGLFVANRAVVADRFAEAVMSLALTELLVSPVSWTHHWSWLAVAPLAVASLWRRHRGVAWMLIALLAVAIVAPYWWFGATGPLTDLTCDSLVLAGSAVLLVWTWAEALAWRREGQASSRRAALIYE